jgi:hypothetical protein
MQSDPLDLGDDVGFIEVQAGGAAVRLDAFEANNRIAAIAQASEGKSMVEFHAAVVELMADLGFPRVSHHMADRFVLGIRRRVEELQSFSDAGTAATAASPTSTPA